MSEAITEDALLGGRVQLRQPAVGYRVAIDPVLLAAAVPAAAGEQVLDVGAGVGAAALCLVARLPGVRAFGIEMQPALVRLAGENVALNEVGGRVDVMLGDLGDPPPRLAAGSFDHVMANPPFAEPGRGTPPRRLSTAVATVESGPGLRLWLSFCLRMTRPRGTVTVIHRADRLAALLTCLAEHGGGVTVYPLWPDATGRKPAKRVILRIQKGVAAPVRLMPGLVLHRPDGAFTEAAETVLRHAGALDLIPA